MAPEASINTGFIIYTKAATFFGPILLFKGEAGLNYTQKMRTFAFANVRHIFPPPRYRIAACKQRLAVQGIKPVNKS